MRSERMTEQDFLELELRRQIRQEGVPPNHKPDPGLESDLVAKIRNWAKTRGYPCLTHPQTKALSWFIPPGYPDVVLSLPYGHTLYLELKAAKGIWKEKQQLIAGQLNQLGHQYFVVRSFKRFLEIVEATLRRE